MARSNRTRRPWVVNPTAATVDLCVERRRDIERAHQSRIDRADAERRAIEALEEWRECVVAEFEHKRRTAKFMDALFETATAAGPASRGAWSRWLTGAREPIGLEEINQQERWALGRFDDAVSRLRDNLAFVRVKTRTTIESDGSEGEPCGLTVVGDEEPGYGTRAAPDELTPQQAVIAELENVLDDQQLATVIYGAARAADGLNSLQSMISQLRSRGRAWPRQT